MKGENQGKTGITGPFRTRIFCASLFSTEAGEMEQASSPEIIRPAARPAKPDAANRVRLVIRFIRRSFAFSSMCLRFCESKLTSGAVSSRDRQIIKSSKIHQVRGCEGKFG